MKCSVRAISVPDIAIALRVFLIQRRAFPYEFESYNSTLLICDWVAYFINNLEGA